MSMVERVARATCDFRTPCPGAACSVCVSRARAAIAAMREPTAKMLEYEVRLVHNDEYAGVDTMCATALWHAMIDVALSEGNPGAPLVEKRRPPNTTT